MPIKDPTLRKKKNREYQKKWYEKNKRLHKERQKEQKKMNKVYLDRYKSFLSCADCGISFRGKTYLCDFHHTNPNTKDKWANVLRSMGRPKMKQEIRKCVPLCANCHRTRHYDVGVGTQPTLIQ